jgi:hypothetical protein
MYQAGSRRTAEDCPRRGVLLEGDSLGGDVTHQRSKACWRLTEFSDHHESRVYTDTHCQPHVHGRSRWTRLFIESLQ